MTAGIVLILTVLVLGGVIAIVSDRLGSKVGKARLTVFNLRPRHTAILVTVLTGSILAALTLIILFAASKPLRTGVFRVDDLQNSLRFARKELAQTQTELTQIKAEKRDAMAKFEDLKKSSQLVITQQASTEAMVKNLQQQLDKLRSEKAKMELELRQTEQQLQVAYQQKIALQAELQRLQMERKKLINYENP